MPHSPRVSYCVLLTLCLVGFVLRYPRSEHEFGVDSFVWHGMVTSLNFHHFALWVLNPLSYFGLYPLSQPSGSVFLLSAMSQIAAVPAEPAILMLDFAVAALGTLGAFLLGREFSSSPTIALLVALVLSLTPEFIGSLMWQVPTRILFTAMIPYLLWAMIRFTRAPSIRAVLLLAVVLALMMSFHRLAILMALVALASLITLLLLVAVRALRLQFPSLFLRPVVLRNTSWLALAGVLTVSVVMIVQANVLKEYSSGVIASGDTVEIQLLNLFVSLARSAGLLLPLAFLGIGALTRRRAKGFAEPFIVVALLAFLPTLFLRQYTGFYTIPITSILIVVGLDALIAKLKHRVVRFSVVATAIGIALASGNAIVSYDLAQDTPLGHREYSLALYSMETGGGSWVFSEGLEGARVSAISGVKYLPVGGATTAFQGPELLTFGYLDRNGLNIRPLKITDLTIESDSPFFLDGVQAEADWAALHGTSVDSMPSRLVNVYQPRYLVTDNAHPFSYYAYGRYYPSELALSAASERYAVYSDGIVTLWLL